MLADVRIDRPPAGSQIKPSGLELRRPDGQSRRFGPKAQVAVLSGEPTELVLYLSGRRGVAEVTLDGPPDAIARVQQAQLNL